MSNKRTFIFFLLLLILTFFIINETWPIIQSEAKIRRNMLRMFPIGTMKSVVVKHAIKNFELPSYKLQNPNEIIYRVSELKGFVVVLISWEFDEKNRLIEIEVRKDYGP